MKYEFTDSQKRETTAQRKLGIRKGKCHLCEERRPKELMRRGCRIICYECQALLDGKRATEGHHVMGKANDPYLTGNVPTNDHRELSDRQVDWPDDTLRNPRASPLRKAAAAIRGWLDILWLIMEHAVGWIPEFLEWLDDQLNEREGPDWHLKWGWNQA